MKNTRILLTGFRPFDGRSVNASWIAASRAAAAGDPGGPSLRALEVPVEWGAPWRCLRPLLDDWAPTGIIAMGEGAPEAFRLETQAHNRRRERPDNAGRLPQDQPVDPEGPALRPASADCHGLRQTLAAAGMPVELSTDAGGYLCEEMLYVIESLRELPGGPAHVLFVHLPPFGTPLTCQGESLRCDETVLERFAGQLIRAFVGIQQSATEQTEEERRP